MTTLEKHILSLQQKVEQLNSELLTLLALTSSDKAINDTNNLPKNTARLIDSTSSANKKSQVGINRYRQMRASD